VAATRWLTVDDDDLIDGAIGRARTLLEAAHARKPVPAERLLQLLATPDGARFARELADRVLRLTDDPTAARELAQVLDEKGIPQAMGAVDRAALLGAKVLARRAPAAVMRLARARLRSLTSAIVVPAEDRPLGRHLARRRAEGFDSNVNLLGEAILGDSEAARRGADIVAMLQRDDVSVMSVKASSVVANLSSLAQEATQGRVVVALRPILRAASSARPPRLVMLDMEEYRDLELTTGAFRQILDEPEFETLEAGIVVQAYLPDSVRALESLAAWATERHTRTGARVKVRIVKGANLAMEHVDAELHYWAVATYTDKADVDANAKRLVELALHPDHIGALRVGVASHNPFDIGWALELRSRCTAPGNVEIEMLEGVADRLAHAVRGEAGRVLLYTPVVRRDDFPGAIAYLARRLDEVSNPQNVLGRLAAMRGPGDAFEREAARFAQSVRDRHRPTAVPRREAERAARTESAFANVADTDFTSAANRRWIVEALGSPPPEPPPVVRTTTEVDDAIARARAAGQAWAAASPAERASLLSRLAGVLEAHRDEAIAHMVHEAHKVVTEADVEVSEAIDYARYYAGSVRELAALEGAVMRPHDVTTVVPPWNFPFAIPAGGVFAALAAASAVILKPAPETPATAWLLARLVAEAGGPPDLVQYLRCPDDEIGRHLVTHPDVGAVVLTGSIETAELFRHWHPRMRLHAETSGKNAIVVTATADIDHAVRDVVRSAFGHAGQKCSAASLAIVEAPVYDAERFREQLRDAVASLSVGDPTDLESVVPPLIGPPSPALTRAFTALDDGEAWLVAPRCLDEGRNLWSPGVRIGVQRGSWFHQTECFGPVLGVMRARDLDDAIAMQNDTPFGLTGGIEALDPHEVVEWTSRVEVGNAYVNRPITGAIVRRQPFGGWKASVVGPAAKAGGPNYVLSLCRWSAPAARDGSGVVPAVARAVLADARSRLDDASYAALERTAQDYGTWWSEHFAIEHDPSGLGSESNVFRYAGLPRGVLVAVDDGTDPLDVERARLAAAVCRSPLRIVPAALVPAISDLTEVPDRVRLLGQGEHDEVWSWAAKMRIHVDDQPVLDHGRLELWRWLREQSVSESTHRMGTLLGRARDRVRPGRQR
jgi:RHH-type proline utilization regulon transcriptional repressor/proline dehydrogenase/delta 1-pyrroline-5-carboxylate dehydrogenase